MIGVDSMQKTIVLLLLDLLGCTIRVIGNETTDKSLDGIAVSFTERMEAILSAYVKSKTGLDAPVDLTFLCDKLRKVDTAKLCEAIKSRLLNTEQDGHNNLTLIESDLEECFNPEDTDFDLANSAFENLCMQTLLGFKEFADSEFGSKSEFVFDSNNQVRSMTLF